MNKEKISILIAGQGIAGTSLAFSFLENNCSVKIIDDGHRSSASMVAAGMWNPVSFKKLGKGWKADEQLAAASDFYTRTEQTLGCRFFHPKRLLRILPDQRTANEWDEKTGHPEFSGHLESGFGIDIPGMEHPFGIGIVKRSGWCNIPAYLSAARAFFSEKKMLSETSFDPEKLHFNGNIWEYNGDLFHHVILCIGSKNSTLPYFDWVPVYPNKGQVLTIRFNDFSSDEMINYGNFILPLGNSEYKVGATYEFNDPNPEPTEETRNTLLKKLNTLLPEKQAEVIGHQAQYRPTVPDRKPTIGSHPLLKNLYLFNGFGSKGVLYVPYCIPFMTAHILRGSTIPAEIDCRRYWKSIV